MRVSAWRLLLNKLQGGYPDTHSHCTEMINLNRVIPAFWLPHGPAALLRIVIIDCWLGRHVQCTICNIHMLAPGNPADLGRYGYCILLNHRYPASDRPWSISSASYWTGLQEGVKEVPTCFTCHCVKDWHLLLSRRDSSTWPLIPRFAKTDTFQMLNLLSMLLNKNTTMWYDFWSIQYYPLASYQSSTGNNFSTKNWWKEAIVLVISPIYILNTGFLI